MTNLRALHNAMVKGKHPGAPIVGAALDCSNSPEFIRYVAIALGDAARADEVAERKLIEHLSKMVGSL